MTKTYCWTTPRGAKVEMTVISEHITSRTTSADGWPIEVKCNEWHYQIDKMLVNGKAPKMHELGHHGRDRVVIIDRIGKDSVMAAIPADIAADIFGEEMRYHAEQARRAAAAEEKYMDNYNMVKKAMDM